MYQGKEQALLLVMELVHLVSVIGKGARSQDWSRESLGNGIDRVRVHCEVESVAVFSPR